MGASRNETESGKPVETTENAPTATNSSTTEIPSPGTTVAPLPDSSGIPRIKQAHGGALLARGVKRNRGGGNPALLRAKCRKEFELLIPVIRKIAKGQNQESANRLRAIDLFGKYGMDDTVSVSDIRDALQHTRAEIDELLPREQADMLWERIASHWLAL